MFDTLSSKFGQVFEALKRRGSLSEADIKAAMREIRVVLLEADVALPVARDFIKKMSEKALGQQVLRSVAPGEQIVKIIYDGLVEMLGDEAVPLNLKTTPPACILMVGLQGSGKTTSTAKLALYLKNKEKKRVLMVSLDTRRPAAREQLATLGKQIQVDVWSAQTDTPLRIAKEAKNAAKKESYDVLLLDSAGRVTVDTELMAEIKEVRAAIQPSEVLLVADAMTGQDAVQTAEQFHNIVTTTGILLTRIDGDARGGAALSMRAVTGQPIKFLGVGEQPDALEVFHPDRIANRILDRGDVLSLVEKAAEAIDQEDAAKMAEKLRKGSFTLDDFATQLRQVDKLGGISSVLGLLPGLGKLKSQTDTNHLEKKIHHQEAIIRSMTKAERQKYKIINGSRRRRIASGAGVTVHDVNNLLKQFQQIRSMMKKMQKGGMKGMMKQFAGLGGPDSLSEASRLLPSTHG